MKYLKLFKKILGKNTGCGGEYGGQHRVDTGNKRIDVTGRMPCSKND